MKWNGVREALGFAGVVASLLFVGLEIRQSTAATKGQTRQELAALNQEWLILLTSDEYFGDLFFAAWIEGEEIDPADQVRADFMMTLNVRRLENVFFQFQEGLVDETALRSYGFQDMDVSSPNFAEWWVEKDWRAAFHPDFVAFLEDGAGAP